MHLWLLASIDVIAGMVRRSLTLLPAAKRAATICNALGSLDEAEKVVGAEGKAKVDQVPAGTQYRACKRFGPVLRSTIMPVTASRA